MTRYLLSSKALGDNFGVLVNPSRASGLPAFGSVRAPLSADGTHCKRAQSLHGSNFIQTSKVRMLQRCIKQAIKKQRRRWTECKKTNRLDLEGIALISTGLAYELPTCN